MLTQILKLKVRHLIEDFIYANRLSQKPHDKHYLNQDKLQKNMNEYLLNADKYFASLDDSPYHLNKPFESPSETHEYLWKFALAIADLQLAPGHTILDFGCGTCWTSEWLKRMDLYVYALDVSKNALKIGEKVVSYDERTKKRGKIDFLKFDGTTIPLGDNSVDRILCFDSFHHVSNMETVLKEFYRVLTPGGIIGISEPGWGHASAPLSIKEAEQYGVIENDIIVEDIWNISSRLGFDHGWVKPVLPLSFSIPIMEFNNAKFGCFQNSLNRITGSLFENMVVFFLSKGSALPDSRRPSVLSAEIKPSINQIEGTDVDIAIAVKNTGDTIWLSQTFNGKGEVKLGIHLYDDNMRLINNDFDRVCLPKDMCPGDNIILSLQRSYQLTKGEHYLVIDMVSEHIKWFNDRSNELQRIKIVVGK